MVWVYGFMQNPPETREDFIFFLIFVLKSDSSKLNSDHKVTSFSPSTAWFVRFKWSTLFNRTC